MTGMLATPRYNAEDFETASIRSAAPSYVSEVPSYHSTAQQSETAPAYTPRGQRASSSVTAAGTREQRRPAAHGRQHSVGLPPIPSAPAPGSMPNLHNFRIPNWSTHNTLASRHYQNVAERRVSDGRYGSVENLGAATTAYGSGRRYGVVAERMNEPHESEILRPLEDPYLVGEVAAAKARRERLARENGDDILIREDRQWDWMLSQMKDWEARGTSWTKFRRELDMSHRKKIMRRIGNRLL